MAQYQKLALTQPNPFLFPRLPVTLLCMTSAFSQGGDVMGTAYHWTATLSLASPIGRPPNPLCEDFVCRVAILWIFLTKHPLRCRTGPNICAHRKQNFVHKRGETRQNVKYFTHKSCSVADILSPGSDAISSEFYRIFTEPCRFFSQGPEASGHFAT